MYGNIGAHIKEFGEKPMEISQLTIGFFAGSVL